MILQILSLVALAGDHSNLHPQDADLFVCAPDLQGAITASEGVALRRLLKDPDIVKLLGDDLELRHLVAMRSEILPGDGTHRHGALRGDADALLLDD